MVIENIEEGKAIKNKLLKEKEEKQKLLDQKQKGLEKKQQDLQKQSMVLSEAVKEQKWKDLQKELFELSETFKKMQAELAQKESDQMGKVLQKVDLIINRIGAEQDYTFIVDAARFESPIPNVLFPRFEKPNELTSTVIKLYNEKYPLKK